jgi:hypothetical protein
MDRKYVLKALADAGVSVPANISNAKLEALASEKGIPLTDPTGIIDPAVVPPGVVLPPDTPPVAQTPAATDDIAWRVAAGLSYEQAVECSNRQKEADAKARK